MKNFIGTLVFIFSLCNFASAQVAETARHTARHQVTVQIGGVVTRKVTDSDVTYEPTSSGAGLVGYRFNINRWLGVEGDYDFFRNTQKFSVLNTSASLRTNVHAATGAAVINLPNPITKRIRSYALVGGGALLFDPRDTDSIDRQFNNVIVFGGGADFAIARHISIRGQAKTYLYKAPDFTMSSLHTNKFVQTMVPSVGIVYSF